MSSLAYIRESAKARRSQLRLLALALLAAFTVALLVRAPLCAAQSSATPLTNEVSITGSLAANATAYYSFWSRPVSYQQTALISVSASVGSPSLYVSLSNPSPSASSFDHAASLQTGGVVSLYSIQPPYNLYIAVVASLLSRSNYSVLVTAYDSAAKQVTPIPLSSAQPLSSAIVAGEYRHFTFSQPSTTDSIWSTAVALTEAYGQSWLLVNSPNTTALPTLSSCQYMSSSLTFPLVALQQPAAGTWTVGVWSNASSAFSIIAVDNTATAPVELGVAYPGYAVQNRYNYYSIYIDKMLQAANSNTSLAIDLLSLDGDADMYCSVTTDKPTSSNAYWYATGSTPLDRIDVRTAQLKLASADTIYCGVQGFEPTGYTFTAAYGSVILLAAGEALTVQRPAYSSQLFSLVFPATTPWVTLSVVVQVGSLDLSIGAYGVTSGGSSNTIAQASTDSQTVQQLSQDQLCGRYNQSAVPGSEPLLCELQVLVRTSSLSAYRMVAYTSDEVVGLAAGQQFDGVVSFGRSVFFSFLMPDMLSNVTITATVTNGASGLVLSAIKPYAPSGYSPTWTAVQAVGSSVLVFQLAYTDPVVPANWALSSSYQGQYLATLSTTSDAVTFSALYTVTNGSAYSDSIVQLLDGVPQQATVGAGAYAFYYFTAPAAGWPYRTTVSVQWLSGYGALRALQSDAPRPIPLVSDAIPAPNSMLIIDPATWSCNPINSTSCGYSISVQGATGAQEQAVYAITVATSFYMRALYTDASYAEAGSVLPLGGAEYWQTDVGVRSDMAVNVSLLYALSVTSGSVTVFASNTTQNPNASTAQLVWSGVTSAAVLAFPLAQQVAALQVYLTVTCVSADGTPCQYTIEAKFYRERRGQQFVSVLLSQNAPEDGAASAWRHSVGSV